MTGNPLELLVVEDDVLQGRLLKANLDRRGRVHVQLAASGEAAIERLRHGRFDAVVTDLVMPGLDGIELVRRIRETDPSLPVVILTANATLERAVAGIRAGATDFLPKPASIEALLALVERAVAERPLREELSARLERRASAAAGDYIVGRHPLLDEVRMFATRIATVPNARVLITGESGTGKSLLARAIHDLSGAAGRFVEVNCAALPSHLLESELFGHEKGAFTDARAMKRGLIEAAHDGTLLLDEIGAMPLETQAKLLLFLENQEIRRLGSTQGIVIRTRVIAATNEQLEERVRAKQFRLDLLYRLDVTSVRMPALREMPQIVPELARRFTGELARTFGRPEPRLNDASFAPLRDYPWPGNGRELRNVVERALIFHDGGEFAVRPPSAWSNRSATGSGPALEPGLTLEEVERRYLEFTLRNGTGAQLSELAAQLGISRKTLWDKRRRHGL